MESDLGQEVEKMVLRNRLRVPQHRFKNTRDTIRDECKTHKNEKNVAKGKKIKAGYGQEKRAWILKNWQQVQ